ncbi:MAG: hypothetical protein EBR82_60960, partial [Caulobacteraceae bacterium]|nr:hypothetical protein [Caulobacteraceae bacterium]
MVKILEVVASKSSLRELWRTNRVTNKFQFVPHAGQEKALVAKERFVAIIAGTQSGKTAFGPIWLLNEITRCG